MPVARDESFSRVRVVLVNTSHPGNVGAVARAMKNMFLARLYLVEPRQFPHPEAVARASGADDVLATAVVAPSLEAALTGCSLVFGASARRRAIPWPEVDARACAQRVAQAPGEVALVFGREHSGLTNEEMQRCHALVHIPANPDYSSLNLAAAVQVIAYEVMMAVRGEGAAPAASRDPVATAEELEDFYRHLELTLVDIGFLDPANPRQLLRRLRRLYNRAGLEKTELNILRGILTETRKSIGGPEGGSG